MLIRELTAENIYLACGHTDMRKSIDGLAALVVSRFHLDPHQPALFLFCGRRKDRIKGLLWDETGFLLLYKRLEDGKYQWPDEPKDVLEISEQQLRWLTEGLTISPSKLVRKVHPKLTINRKSVDKSRNLWTTSPRHHWLCGHFSGIIETDFRGGLP